MSPTGGISEAPPARRGNSALSDNSPHHVVVNPTLIVEDARVGKCEREGIRGTRRIGYDAGASHSRRARNRPGPLWLWSYVHLEETRIATQKGIESSNRDVGGRFADRNQRIDRIGTGALWERYRVRIFDGLGHPFD